MNCMTVVKFVHISDKHMNPDFIDSKFRKLIVIFVSDSTSFICRYIFIRAESATPVSRYQDQFMSIP